MSRGADTTANTRGAVAHPREGGDLRLLDDGSERGGALDSDEVEVETASEGWDGDGERVGVSTGADTKANTRRGGALELGDSRLFEDGSERGGALIFDVVLLETVNERRDEDGETAGVSRGADMKANASGRRRTPARSRSSS